MMYGISSTAWLKQKIIFALEEETKFISSRELTNIVGDYSQSTIKKICREIQEDLEALYPTELATLIIDQRNGIKLIRKPYVNFQKLLSTIFSAEIGYELLQQLLLKRSISTIDFCTNHYISESQLRRNIKTINTSLEKHAIYISLSNNITIIGDEHRLRAFFFIFLFAIHRQFSYIQWAHGKENCYSMAEQIAHSLSLSTDARTIDILAIWYFITATSIKNNFLLFFDERSLPICECFTLPKRPSLLSNWKEEDWQFLIIAIYAADIIDFNLQVNLQKLEQVTHLEDAAVWIDLFGTHFLPLTDSQQEFVYKKFVKQELSHHFFGPDENLLNNFTKTYAEELKELYPVLVAKYNSLWKQFTQKVANHSYEYFQIESLFLCFYLVPTDFYYPQVTFFMRSDLTFLNTKHLEFRISTRFGNQYSLTFTSDITKADLILSTVSMNGAGEYISNFNHLVPIILINSKISENDFAKIEETLCSITKNLVSEIC